ncbi:unnamed protein product [Diamesa tonsa]
MIVNKLINLCAVLILISVHVQCIRVHEDAKENVTTTLPILSDQRENKKNNESMEEMNNVMKAILSDDKDNHTVETDETTTHRIPPTLTNINTDYVRLSPIKKEKPQQDTKQDAAKPAQVHADAAASETSDFQPSPELSTLYNSQNELRDHFHPTNQYYKPFNQDARYNYETSFNRNPLDDASIETKWLGASELRHNNGNRNTNVHASEPQYNPQVHRHHPYHSNKHHNHQQDDRKVVWPNDVHVSKEDVRTTPVWHNQFRIQEQDSSKDYPKPKGSWKWVPEEQEQIHNLTRYNDEPRIIFDGPSSYYPPPQPEYVKSQPEYVKSQHEYSKPQHEYSKQQPEYVKSQHEYSKPQPEYTRPQSAKDQPYSFDTQDFLPNFSQFFSTLMGHKNTGNTIVSELSPDPRSHPFSSSGHGEIVIPQEYQSSFASTKEDEPSKEVSTEVKTKPHSPWKKIFHVLTAAIPIGIIISALTPKYLYVNPNSTAPVIQQIPNQAYPNPYPNQPISGLGFTSYPRQRSTDEIAYNKDFLNTALIELMKQSNNQNYDFLDSDKIQLGDGMCKDRLFCEIAVSGGNDGAETLHHMLFKVANETPDDQAKINGLDVVFNAIKRRDCEIFDCRKSLNN